jgi:MoCo/4Fe-4S cofactor protein with predicted Tat translocation signal
VTETILVTGAGGVGKTTVSAAIAVTAARNGLRTLVLTVDPAKRLASALGATDLGSEPQPHPDEANLWAAMLDSSQSWRSVAERHADPEVADRLVNNEFFLAASEHFPASQSYAAADQAVTFVEAQAWDLVVVDTPPSAGGIDFFSAPAQMADLVGGRLLRWLTGGPLPGRRFLYKRAGRPVLRMADSLLGSDLLERVAEFLLDLRTTYDGVATRGRQIASVVSRSAILVVTTADPAPVAEASRFYRELPEIARTPTAVVFNRTLPDTWIGAKAPPKTAPTLKANLERWGAESLRQSDARAEFGAVNKAAVSTIPWMPEPPTDVDGLAGLIASAQDFPEKRLGISREA